MKVLDIMDPHDPITVADRLRWAREWYKSDCSQPRDLADLMLRAAETLDKTVPGFWRTLAVLEAIVLFGISILMSR